MPTIQPTSEPSRQPSSQPSVQVHDTPTLITPSFTSTHPLLSHAPYHITRPLHKTHSLISRSLSLLFCFSSRRINLPFNHRLNRRICLLHNLHDNLPVSLHHVLQDSPHHNLPNNLPNNHPFNHPSRLPKNPLDNPHDNQPPLHPYIVAPYPVVNLLVNLRDVLRVVQAVSRAVDPPVNPQGIYYPLPLSVPRLYNFAAFTTVPTQFSLPPPSYIHQFIFSTYSTHSLTLHPLAVLLLKTFAWQNFVNV